MTETTRQEVNVIEFAQSKNLPIDEFSGLLEVLSVISEENRAEILKVSRVLALSEYINGKERSTV